MPSELSKDCRQKNNIGREQENLQITIFSGKSFSQDRFDHSGSPGKFFRKLLAEITEQELNRLYAELFERVVLKENQLIYDIKTSGVQNLIEGVMPNGNVRVVIPIQLRKTGRGRVIVRRDNTQAVQSQIPLLKAIANGIQWQQHLDDGLFKSVQELAKHLGKERATLSHTLQLAQLSPEIIHLAVIGALPEHITLKSLKTGLRADWEEQKKFLRIE